MQTNNVTYANYVAANAALTKFFEPEPFDPSEVTATTTRYKLRVPGEEAHGDAIAQADAPPKTVFFVPSPSAHPWRNVREVLTAMAIAAVAASRSTETSIKAVDALLPNNTAFGELHALRQSELHRLVENIRVSSIVSYGEKLANRLGTLIEAYCDENQGRFLSADSLRGFVGFLEANPTFNYPALTVSPAGNLYAQWKSGNDKLLSIHFLPTGDARFVIFKPNPKHTGRSVHMSCSTTIDTLADAVVPHGVHEWATT